MTRKNLLEIYSIGVTMENLGKFLKKSEDLDKKEKCSEWIDNFLYFFKDIHEHLTSYSGFKEEFATTFTSEILEDINQAQKMRKDENIIEAVDEIKNRIESIYRDFRTDLESLFYRTEIHLFDVETNLNPEKLKKSAKTFISNKKWKNLTERDKLDLKDATNCLLFNLWTPAGMVLMRVAESLVRIYFLKIKSIPTTDMWGKMISNLKQDPASDKKFLGYLDYLKEIRNTLQHPEERLTQGEAEQTFIHILHLIEKV